MTLRLKNIDFLASTALDSDNTTSGFDVSEFRSAVIYVSVTAISGSGAKNVVSIQTSHDNSTYYTVSKFAAITATGNFQKEITDFGKYVRIVSTVTGTSPSITTVIDGDFKQ